jgi:TPR repeat protein
MTIAKSRQAALSAVLRRRDYSRAACLARELAATGDTYGRIVLARLYAEGHGVKQNLAEAERLLDEAQRLGSREAAYQKAVIFSERSDLAGVFTALIVATKAGSLEARTALGRCYLFGVGTPANVALGESLLSEAIARGSVSAKYDLAHYRLLHAAGFADVCIQSARMLFYGLYRRYLRRYRPNSDKLT